jgi:hypothetical protein
LSYDNEFPLIGRDHRHSVEQRFNPRMVGKPGYPDWAMRIGNDKFGIAGLIPAVILTTRVSVQRLGGSDGTRTLGLLRDGQAF